MNERLCQNCEINPASCVETQDDGTTIWCCALCCDSLHVACRHRDDHEEERTDVQSSASA